MAKTKTKKAKPRSALDGDAAKLSQAETPAPVESFTELNWRSPRLALGWIITAADLYFTDWRGPGSRPRAKIADGQIVRNPIRDLRAELNAQELRGKAEAIRTVHPELALAELPKPVGSADQDVWLIGQWARASLMRLQDQAQTKPREPRRDNPPGRAEISLADFLVEYSSEPLKDSRVASLRNRIQAAARRKVIALPPLTRPHASGQTKYYRPESLIEGWPKYRKKLPELPELKP